MVLVRREWVFPAPLQRYYNSPQTDSVPYTFRVHTVELKLPWSLELQQLALSQLYLNLYVGDMPWLKLPGFTVIGGLVASTVREVEVIVENEELRDVVVPVTVREAERVFAVCHPPVTVPTRQHYKWMLTFHDCGETSLFNQVVHLPGDVVVVADVEEVEDIL